MSFIIPATSHNFWEIQYRQMIISKIKELFETKHLYQHVNIDVSEIKEKIRALRDTDEDTLVVPGQTGIRLRPEGIREKRASDSLQKIIHTPWTFVTESNTQPLVPLESIQRGDFLLICLPTIKITCKHCNSILPAHNSGFRGLNSNLHDINFTDPYNLSNGGIKQLFFFPYQCQSCKGEPLVFMVHRDGLDLRMVGRSQFEQVNTPKYIPHKEQKWYRDAVIAFNSGRTLAGLFYLRTMVEQYWRRVLNNSSRISGEDLGDMYAKLLDNEFPQKFTSLKKIYEELSEKIHSALDDEIQFSKSRAEIEQHFDLLQHLPLKQNNT